MKFGLKEDLILGYTLTEVPLIIWGTLTLNPIVGILIVAGGVGLGVSLGNKAYNGSNS